MARTEDAKARRWTAVLLALAVFVVTPLLSASAGAADEMPCPHMAAMNEIPGHDHGAMHPASMPTEHMEEMECCGDGEDANTATMVECSFACKASCLHVVTAILLPGADSAPAGFHHVIEESPPRALTPHADGFTPPPPRI